MSESPVEPMRILMVDDFHDNREMYAAYLRFSGFVVDEAVTGTEAIEKALATRPNLIVMDLSLPGMDGWEATRRLKTDPQDQAYSDRRGQWSRAGRQCAGREGGWL